ncbi:MAG: prolipoprotein diacylglyceryl transferase [Phycisphaerales bacterium]|nr:MAG: prolipoprotein diacylglyceryl transferase [Phycisphaerales bacterium]
MWRHLGPLTTWTALYFTSILIYSLLSYLIAKRLQVRHRVWIVLSLSYLAGMTTGAKLLYDVQHDQFSLWALLTPEHYLAGGLWGGVLAYLVLGVPLALILAKRRRAALDLVALPLPIPMILTKLGCLFNGCCYGRPCFMPWAITFPAGAAAAPPGVPLHPTQTYEVLFLVCVLWAFKVFNHERWRGTMLVWFLSIYGLGRAACELWRADLSERSLTVGSFSMSQLICVIAGCASVVMLCLWRAHTVKAEV